MKKERDLANSEVKKISIENRAKIGELQNLFVQTKELKRQRDEENAKTAEARAKREELKPPIAEAKAKIDELRKKISSESGSPMRIQEELEKLEWIQQTESLSPKQDKELSKKIKDLRKQLPKLQESQSAFAEFKVEKQKIYELISKEKAFHEQVVEHSKKAKALHEELLKASKKISAIQKSLSSSMELLSQKKEDADEKHGKLLQVAGEENARRAEQRQHHEKEESKHKQVQHNKIVDKAKAIYEKFKAGEKISREDLMTLSQSGLL